MKSPPVQDCGKGVPEQAHFHGLQEQAFPVRRLASVVLAEDPGPPYPPTIRTFIASLFRRLSCIGIPSQAPLLKS